MKRCSASCEAETYWHGEDALELPEDHLLTCLDGDTLKQNLCCVARVQVLQEAVGTRLAEACNEVAELEIFLDRLNWIRVLARS